MKLGRGTTDDGTGDTYIGIPVNTSAKRRVSFAFNMNSESTGGQAYDINLRGTNGKTAYIGIVQDGNIVLMSKDDGVTAGATIPYEAGKWYKLDLLVDGANRVYTFTLTKPDGTKETVPGTLRSAMGTTMNVFRVFAPGRAPASDTYMAIDDISVAEPQSPELIITGVSDGAVYSSEAPPTISVTATDDRTVTAVEVLVDGVLVNSIQADSLSYTLAGLAAGPHIVRVVAADDEGLKTEQTIKIYIDAYFVENFTDCVSPSDSKLDINDTGKGYFGINTIDSEHGESLIIGYSSDSTDPEADSYAMLSLGTTANREVSFEVNMSSVNTGGKEYCIQLRTVEGSTSARQVMGYIKDGYIYLQSDNNGTIGAQIPYIPEQWYKITYTVAPAGRVYEITVTKPDGTKEHMTGEIRSSMKRKADRLEIYAPEGASADSFIAMDNIVVKEYKDNVGGMYNAVVSGNDKTYSYSFKMKYSANISGVYVVALYNDGRLVGVKLINMDAAAATHEVTNQSITTADTAATYKVMFFDNLNALTLICDAATGNVVKNHE